jgi:hypothetical protein
MGIPSLIAEITLIAFGTTFVQEYGWYWSIGNGAADIFSTFAAFQAKNDSN